MVLRLPETKEHNCNVTSFPLWYCNVHDIITGVFAWLCNGRAMDIQGGTWRVVLVNNVMLHSIQ